MQNRLITLIVLGLVAWALMHWAREEDLAVPPPVVGGVLYSGLEMDSISHLGMGVRGGDWVEFDRQPLGQWRITHPTDELAEPAFIEHALHALVSTRVLPLERQGIEVDAAAVGLDPPEHSLVFEANGHHGVLFLGKLDVFGKGLFARRGDTGDVLLISPLLLTHLEQYRPEDYVDKSLFRGYAGRIVGLRIEGPAGVAVDAEREGLGWRVTEPTKVRGDRSRLDAVVRSLQYANQQRVGATNPDDDLLRLYGLPTSDMRARRELGDATLIELRPENEPPLRLYLQRDWRLAEGIVYAIREDGHKLLGIEQRAFSALWEADTRPFLDPQLWPPLRERAHHFSVLLDDELLLDLRRGARGDWVFRAPERLAGQPVEHELIDGRSSLSDLFDFVDGLRAVGAGAVPEGPPRLTVSAGWEAAGSFERDRLEVFALDGESLPARFSGRLGEDLQVGPEVLELLDPFLPDRLRSLRPIDLAPEAWARQRVRLPQLDAPLEFARPQDGEALDAAGSAQFALAQEWPGSLRGLAWARSPGDAVAYPWAVSWFDAQGERLGALELRRVGAGEPDLVLGLPVVRARWSGVPGAELVLEARYLDQLLAVVEG